MESVLKPLISKCSMMPACHHCVPKSGHVEEFRNGKKKKKKKKRKKKTICSFQVYICITLTKEKSWSHIGVHTTNIPLPFQDFALKQKQKEKVTTLSYTLGYELGG